MFMIRLIVLLFLVAYSWSMGQIPTHELNSFGRMVSLSFFLAAPALYMLPTYEAWKNNHANITSIAIVNLFLGWSLIGWVIAMAWAFKKSKAHVNIPMPIQQPHTENDAVRICPFCAEEVKPAAVVCKHCGRDLPVDKQ